MSRLVLVQKEKERFTSLAEMRERLREWYRCPICEQTSQVHALNDQLLDRRVVKQIFLDCGHCFPAFLPLKPVNVLHTNIMDLFLTFESKDKNGRLIQRLHQRSHSYLTQFIQGLYGFFGYNFDANTAPTAITIKDEGGTSRSFPPPINTVPTSYSHTWAALRNATFTGGLDVGTGTTPNTPSTFTSAAGIANGVGAGQLSYGSMSVTVPGTVGSVTSFTISRTFTNSSGATIIINEAILSAVAFISTGPEVDAVFANVRDVLPTGVAVLNGGSTTGTYTISVTTT